MPKTKYEAPQSMRLSREALDVLDSISRELNLRSRNAAVELLARVARRSKGSDVTWEELLLGRELVRDAG